jgi:hypothetical protein
MVIKWRVTGCKGSLVSLEKATLLWLHNNYVDWAYHGSLGNQALGQKLVEIEDQQ